MDTRRKIVSADRAIAIAQELHEQNIPVRVVSGYFDVLQAATVRQMNALGDSAARLFALVLEPERPITSAAARAELAAALRVVNFVVSLGATPDEQVQGFVTQLGPRDWFREESAHQLGTDALVRNVQFRNGRAGEKEQPD